MRGKLGWVLFVLGGALVVFAILRVLGNIPVSASTLGTTVACPSPVHYMTTLTASPNRACAASIDDAVIEAVAAFAVGIVLIVIATIKAFRTFSQ